MFKEQTPKISRRKPSGGVDAGLRKDSRTALTRHIMGLIKGRNGMNLTEAEDIKKRWQEYTELYKKDLHNQDNHDGVITHLELRHPGM